MIVSFILIFRFLILPWWLFKFRNRIWFTFWRCRGSITWIILLFYLLVILIARIIRRLFQFFVIKRHRRLLNHVVVIFCSLVFLICSCWTTGAIRMFGNLNRLSDASALTLVFSLRFLLWLVSSISKSMELFQFTNEVHFVLFERKWNELRVTNLNLTLCSSWIFSVFATW